MGEHERSYLVFRAMIEGGFLRDSGAAGFLESQGRFVRGVNVLSRLLREYPPEGYAAEAAYALAQHVYANAPETAVVEGKKDQPRRSGAPSLGDARKFFDRVSRRPGRRSGRVRRRHGPAGPRGVSGRGRGLPTDAPHAIRRANCSTVFGT